MNGPVGLDTAYKTLYNLFYHSCWQDTKSRRSVGAFEPCSLSPQTHGQELTGIPVRGAGLCLVMGSLTA